MRNNKYEECMSLFFKTSVFSVRTLSPLCHPLLLLAILTLSSCARTYSGKKQPLAKNGVLDLRGWNFEKDGPVKLNGEWEFYWKQLLVPDDFGKKQPPRRTGLINLPRAWKGYRINQKELPARGYATFRIRISPGKSGTVMGIKMLDTGVPFTLLAYNLFIGDKLVHSNGTVGKKAETSDPRHIIGYSSFSPGKNRYDIVIQASNVHDMQVGTLYPIMLGTERQIRKYQTGRLNFDLFLFGSLLIMGLYHLGLFLIRRKDPGERGSKKAILL